MAALGNIAQQVVDDNIGQRITYPAAFGAKDISLYIPFKAIEDPAAFPAVEAFNRWHIRGTLKNSAGAAIARTVIALDQATQKVVDSVVSDAVTGAFELRPYNNSRCSVFHVPELGDAKNGVVFSHILPLVS